MATLCQLTPSCKDLSALQRISSFHCKVSQRRVTGPAFQLFLKLFTSTHGTVSSLFTTEIKVAIAPYDSSNGGWEEDKHWA